LKKQVSVLVVCTGNICRSPTGEGVLRHLAQQRGLADKVKVASAGTHDYHVGECPDARTIKHAKKRGYDLSAQRAQQLSADHFHEFDYILAMDRGHLRIARSMAPKDAKARLGMFLEASARWRGADVPDPYYQGVEAFEQVLDMVEEGRRALAGPLRGEPDPSAFRLQSR
jgi:protein-tyrosine phosphatase